MAEQKLTAKIPKTMAADRTAARALIQRMFAGTDLVMWPQKRGKGSRFWVFTIKGENVRDQWNSVKVRGVESETAEPAPGEAGQEAAL